MFPVRSRERAVQVRRLVDFPYVVVRLRCELCKRVGAYRLARLAVKYGSEILLDDPIEWLSELATERDTIMLCAEELRAICPRASA